MAKVNNPFTMRDEIILIEYKDVIKCPSAGVLKLIQDDYMDDLRGVINTKLLKEMDFKNLQRFAIERPCKNILDYIKTTDFDTNAVYDALYNAYDTIYMELPLMTIGKSLYFISQQKFTKKIYIYSEEYDKKIEFDIKENYCEMKNIYYVAGDLSSIINSIEPVTSYIFADVDNVKTIMDLDKMEYTEIMIGEYGYNYEIKNSTLTVKGGYENMTYDKRFKIASFTPLAMDKSYFNV
jgi:hypothetical protein